MASVSNNKAVVRATNKMVVRYTHDKRNNRLQYPGVYVLVRYGQNPNVKGHAKIHTTGWGDASITFFSKVERLLFAAPIAVNAFMVGLLSRSKDHCRMTNGTLHDSSKN
jgi:hypothetical protein